MNMKGKLKALSKIFMVMNYLALVLVAQTANAACLWIFYQPEFPKEAKKFGRIK